MIFTPHGLYDIELYPNYIKVNAAKSWNRELTSQFQSQIRASITENFRGQRWGGIIFLDEWIVSNDCLVLLEDISKFCIDHGMCVGAFVSNNCYSSELIRRFFLKQNYQDFTSARFNNLNRAIKWTYKSLNTLNIRGAVFE